MKTLLVAISVLCLVWLTGCSGGAVEETRSPTSIIPAAAQSSPTPRPGLSPTPTGPIPEGILLDKDLSMRVAHPTGTRIESISIGLNNEIYVIDKGDTIYQLMEDGKLEEHLVFPGEKIDDFDIALDGSFWFTNNGGGLYHVDNLGKPKLVADQVNRVFDFDSTSNLFAVDRPSDNVQKITPDGKVETIASGFQTQRIRVAPDGSIYVVTFSGELARVETDGSLKIIATGFGVENVPAFAPDGAMYILSPGGLKKVDPSTGGVEQLKWYDRYRGLPDTLTLVFDRKGIGYLFHPIMPLYRVNLAAQTLEVVYSPRGNSWALGVDPLSEAIYVAYGDHLPGGKTTLFLVDADGGLEEIGSVPYGMEQSMTFAPEGVGYLSVADSDKGALIYKFDPQNGSLEEFYQPQCNAQGMAVEPVTGALWWTECDHLASYHAQTKKKETIPYLEGVNNSTIAFDADGTLYALAWLLAPAPNLPMPHGIYRNENGSWTLLKDMTAKDPGITLASLTTCPDGHIYVAASIDGQDISRDYTSMSSMLRLEDDNSLTVLGNDLGGYDPLSITCTASGTLYFTNGAGIYAISKLGAVP